MTDQIELFLKMKRERVDYLQNYIPKLPEGALKQSFVYECDTEICDVMIASNLAENKCILFCLAAPEHRIVCTYSEVNKVASWVEKARVLADASFWKSSNLMTVKYMKPNRFECTYPGSLISFHIDYHVELSESERRLEYVSGMLKQFQARIENRSSNVPKPEWENSVKCHLCNRYFEGDECYKDSADYCNTEMVNHDGKPCLTGGWGSHVTDMCIYPIVNMEPFRHLNQTDRICDLCVLERMRNSDVLYTDVS